MPAKAPTPRSANTGPIILTAVGRVATDSNAYWTEEDVFVTLAEPINTLQLTVRIAPSPGLSGAQPWSNHNTSTFDMSVTSSAEGLFYDFKLKPGASVPAGQIEFAVQFGHRSSPHDMSGDTYSLSVTTDPAHGSVSGASAGGF